ncbi:ATP-binding protein [Methylobacterium sp. J-059]|uniref:AAA family ATPase n=1 Tax=Methylobacterium sp. J-059 TaxID=2836643 RepID=UPI001FBB93E8|nr:AAA family ATPase [Methylobacterium sp. J-059]MCJ2042886.1 ATP-binding protein [Methylobacterium sp. J-059]
MSMAFGVPGKTPTTHEDWQRRVLDALDAFSPGAPIDEASLLAGRSSQIDRMIETVFQRGQHAILYGERGVGKSSLANTFSAKVVGGARIITSVPVNCHPSDDFSRIWRNVFRRLSREGKPVSEYYPSEIYPDDVVVELSQFSLNTIPIIILDEFDKLMDQKARNLVANTIKDLSDRSVKATIILVGVADSIGDLIDEHQSISRCLHQIQMQRMMPSELKEIVSSRLGPLGMLIRGDALNHVVSLSRGLPHYTHLFGQQAAKKALEAKTLVIDLEHLDAALPDCIERTDQMLRKNYHKAVSSPRRENIYTEVLLASALAPVDDLGYFAPADLRTPLSELLLRDAPVSLYGQHLKKLCENDRGNPLEITGTDRKFRYRFVEPMMQPFILMNGLKKGLITRKQIEDLAANHYHSAIVGEL